MYNIQPLPKIIILVLIMLLCTMTIHEHCILSNINFIEVKQAAISIRLETDKLNLYVPWWKRCVHKCKKIYICKKNGAFSFSYVLVFNKNSLRCGKSEQCSPQCMWRFIQMLKFITFSWLTSEIHNHFMTFIIFITGRHPGPNDRCFVWNNL